MRNSPSLKLCALLSALPAAALAAEPAPEPTPVAGNGCQPVVAKLQVDCKGEERGHPNEARGAEQLAGDTTKEAEAKQLGTNAQLDPVESIHHAPAVELQPKLRTPSGT